MKYISILFLLGISLTFLACNDDEEDNSVTADLFYDMGANSAPFFGMGTHQAAVRFPRSIMSSFEGEALERIEFYLVNLPNNCFIKIYDEGTAQGPGPLLYEADVTTTVNANAWNGHTLTAPLPLSSNELWIAVEFTHNEQNNTIGCDVGPAVENGDWVSEMDQTGWSSYRNFTSDAVSINWNIRGFIQ